MGTMRYKPSDRVRIKSIDWYNENKTVHGDVWFDNAVFVGGQSLYCGCELTIRLVTDDHYYVIENDYYWTDEMIEGLVEEGTNKLGTALNPIEPKSNANCLTMERVDETKPEPKFKVGDKVILDLYPCTVTDVHWRDSLHGFAYTVRGADFGKMVGETDLIFDTSEETPKFKVNDIVFVKNIGWVRITNSYWDSLANEYIYEAIGFNGEGEYDCISQSNIEDQMLPESENPHTGGNKITLDEYKNNDKEWLFNKLAMLDNITALESIQDIFNHLQQSKYPKTYEECGKIMNCPIDGPSGWLFNFDANIKDTYYRKIDILIGKFTRLLICRDAYWMIYGEEMGLGKSWEPNDSDYITGRYCIFAHQGNIICSTPAEDCPLTFPTEEMRDAFYENFKELIESCKELL